MEAPLPSIIPVTLKSSGSAAAPVLTFLPIGKASWFALPLLIFTFCFLGSGRIGLVGKTWQFKSPGSIGVL